MQRVCRPTETPQGGAFAPAASCCWIMSRWEYDASLQHIGIIYTSKTWLPWYMRYSWQHFCRAREEALPSIFTQTCVVVESEKNQRSSDHTGYVDCLLLNSETWETKDRNCTYTYCSYCHHLCSIMHYTAAYCLSDIQPTLTLDSSPLFPSTCALSEAVKK